ncbi:MAG: HAMP domain-containing sensor histidine kinase [Microcoleaceae cyanobacterium]
MTRLSLPTISEIIAQNSTDPLSHSPVSESSPNLQDFKAQREWYSAVQTINQLLEQLTQHSPETIDLDRPSVGREERCHPQPRWSTLNQLPPPQSQIAHAQGVVFSGPSAILMHPALASNFATQLFVPQNRTQNCSRSQQTQTLPLPPASEKILQSKPPTSTISLSNDDPLTQEPFSIVLTTEFSLVMALGVDPAGNPKFLFSFEPNIVNQVLAVLRHRLQTINYNSQQEGVSIVEEPLVLFDNFVEQFSPIVPHYKTVMQFSRLMLNNLPLGVQTKGESIQPDPHSPAKSTSSNINLTDGDRTIPKISVNSNGQNAEVELLQAMAHEVRTPLATIRTLTRLLLKRRQLDPDLVRKRLEMIDQECTTQIDRFNLIFKAVELEVSRQQSNSQKCHKRTPIQLTALSLGDVFNSSVPRWQKQAHQRDHTLDVVLPPNLPTVVSDPTMLDQVLTGLIENFSRSLPSGSHIQMGVCLAGNQLKLQLESQADHNNSNSGVTPKSPLKSIGPLLMFQPETGSLSLNLSVTKNLFQALGGKLVVRQRSKQGKVMTIFLPLKN